MLSAYLNKTFLSCFQAERDRLIRSQQYDQEENLAKELARKKQEELRNEKVRQQIRETR